MIVNQQVVCINWPMCISLVIIYINYIIIICHTVYKCNTTIIQRRETQDNFTEHVTQIRHTDIDIEIEQSYDIVNYIITTTNNTTCSICLEEQKINENWSKLLCEHEFHKKCIRDWLTINNVCPVCRRLINSANNVNYINYTNNRNNANNANNANNNNGINNI